LAPKAAVLCEVTHNEGHWAVQSHSILVSIENAYASSC